MEELGRVEELGHEDHASGQYLEHDLVAMRIML
jgi:hypothetical protein